MRARIIALVALLLLAAVPGSAAAEPDHAEPQGPAKVGFAPDFPKLLDHEWGFRLGGFGGTAKGAPLRHVPVIFVHGNNVDAADWYPVRDAFRAAGWRDQELWALSYNGLGSNVGTAVLTPNPERDAEHEEMGWDGQVRVTSNEVNVPDLYDVILAVRAYTGSEHFSIVGHSLGVTLARRTLKVHPELREDLVGFVGIAGANHGTSLCPPGSEGNVVSCDEIAEGTAWLEALNGPDGADETYAPAKWLTILDGSGVGDPAFAGTYQYSPRLDGAENREYAGTYHNDLRLSPEIVAVYRAFLETAEVGILAAQAPDPGPITTPGGATGGGGAFASPGGFVAPEVAAAPPRLDPVTPAPSVADATGADRGAGAADAGGPVLRTTQISRLGRHWSGAANAAMVLLLAAGVGLLAFDRRRSASQEVLR